jgi:REP element-mobilizing transposase RayT
LARSRRVSWLNYPHLVIAKANGGVSLFSDEEDYLNYLSMLKQMVRDRLLKVFAYCLLPDEVRLVVMPHRMGLSRIIQRLHTRHTARMNNKLNRCGHLFRSRYRSLVFCEPDLLDVVRSVHLWPVRIGLLRRPEAYLFSSHASYLGYSSNNSELLNTSLVLDKFSGDLITKRRAFARFVEREALACDNLGIEEIAPGIGGTKHSANELLKKSSINILEPKKSSIKLLAERTSLLLGISLEQLTGSSRRQDLVMARRLLASAAVLGAGRSVTEVAVFLQRDKGQVSRLVAQGMDLLVSNHGFGHMFASLKTKGVQDPFLDQVSI